jgi:DNA mismatch repair protein MutL
MEEGRIGLLPPEVARRIAAGEVIERPASVVRELLENAIDSGAEAISLSLEGGGIESIRVSDDGDGIDSQDFPLLCRPHATSKIRMDDDLLRVRTLGFRGEALASIAAVAELEIVSSRDGLSAARLFSRPGREAEISAIAGRKGTSVAVKGLFDRFPARKRFLKRAQTETTLCTQVFIDKALPHPGVDFRLTVDGEPRRLLPPSSLKTRVIASYPADEPESLFRTAECSMDGLVMSVVHAGAEALRPDRRHMQCFVNRRRVQDFGLLKALEIGFSGFIPGGLFPFAFLFLEIPTDRVDFNIHPAKKEIRFKDSRSVQTAVIRCVSRALESEGAQRKAPRPFATDPSPSPTLWSGYGDNRPAGEIAAAEKRESPEWPSLAELKSLGASRPSSAFPLPGEASRHRVIGQVLGVFILFEADDALFFLDQHAAHERLIFDALATRPPRSQSLLIPAEFKTESEEDEAFLTSRIESLSVMGFSIERGKGGVWRMLAQPEGFKGDPASLSNDLRAASAANADPLRAARALTACRSAIKEGDALDMAAMEALVRDALDLPEKRCPHGRPILFSVDREEAYERVLRIVR